MVGGQRCKHGAHTHNATHRLERINQVRATRHEVLSRSTRHKGGNSQSHSKFRNHFRHETIPEAVRRCCCVIEVTNK